MNARGALRAAFFVAVGAVPVRGQDNHAPVFTVAEFVQVASSPSLNSISSALTVEAWVRATLAQSNLTALRRNLTNFVNGGEVIMLRIDSMNLLTNQMKPRFYLGVGPDSFFVEGTVPLSLGFWHHWAATFDGTFMRMFWDGALVAIAPHPGVVASTAAPLFLGTGVGNPFDSWRGNVDEVRLWNVARSQAEIQSSSYAVLTGSEPGLVAYWRFEEGGGQFAADTTPNGNVGVFGALPVPDPSDPAWAVVPFIEAFSVAPSIGPFYAASAVTIAGSGFVAGGPPTVTVGGVSASAVTVVGPGTLQAVFPAGPAGPADVVVSNGLGSDVLAGGWHWADHLYGATTSISAAAGGAAPLTLFGEPGNAGKVYLVGSSVSGTFPGIPLPGTSLVVPLNHDPWMDLALGTVNSPLFANFFGTLDGQGQATASFNAAPGPLPTAAIGLEASFAYVVIDPPPVPAFALASNAVTVTVLP
ncbi:MAG TPA: LamG-like jellyroll fold domain-containing protein [Planctomycetota bacterium]|jgi:hypothetical protein|nr:LamG-like jellyroll fold domain-containing protein [Planctomycetota bacterium]